MKMAPYRSGSAAVQPAFVAQVIDWRSRDGRDCTQAGQERLPTDWADSLDPIQFRADDTLLTPLFLEGQSETVRFITDTLQKA